MSCIEFYDLLKRKTVTRALPVGPVADCEWDGGGLRALLRPDGAAKALMARHARVLAETFGESAA